VLDSSFRSKCYDFLDEVKRVTGVDIVPYMGLRTISHQNTLFRQSRSLDEIEKKIALLRKNGAPYLADQLAATAPATGKQVTNVPGGLSWHNWGLAIDFYVPGPSGMPVWDGKDPLYAAAGKVAIGLGLTWGGKFKSFPDYGHVQMPSQEITDKYSYAQVDDHFKSSAQ